MTCQKGYAIALKISGGTLDVLISHGDGKGSWLALSVFWTANSQPQMISYKHFYTERLNHWLEQTLHDLH